jgi:hypothetical protein
MTRFAATVLLTGLFLGAGATAASAAPDSRPAPSPMVTHSLTQTACGTYFWCAVSPTAAR